LLLAVSRKCSFKCGQEKL